MSDGFWICGLAVELGDAALTFDQDTSNVEAVQAGLRTTARPSTALALYQESGIRLLHDTLSYYTDRGEPPDSGA